MIIKTRKGNYLIWDTKFARTQLRPMLFRKRLNLTTGEIEFQAIRFINAYSYSMSELEEMLKELKKINKEIKKE